jgi:hypothetical protein
MHSLDYYNSQAERHNVITIQFLNMNQHQSTTTLRKFLDVAAAPTLPCTQYTENLAMNRIRRSEPTSALKSMACTSEER